MYAIERYLLGRRAVLKGAGGLAAYAALPGLPSGDDVIRLRLLETSDLHMFIYDYDYYRDRPDQTLGFAKTATLIGEARAEAPNCLLFDNGDLIQGNPLSDYVASGKAVPPADGVHPMFRVLNLVGYDAAALGNHEFNYGLDFLGKAMAGAKFPMVCANLQWVDGTPFIAPSAVLERQLVARDGRSHSLRIGVIGFVPPQITMWDRSRLHGKVKTQDIVEAAKAQVPELRRRCDLVIALCHSGIAVTPSATPPENAALQLAGVPGIDAIMTGHSHRVFPGPDYSGLAGVDAERGTLAGVPAVMPGFWGSHLGVIDLTLQRRDSAWTVAGFSVEARPIYRRDGANVVSLASADAKILDAAATEHKATVASVAQPIGTLTRPIYSYFAFAPGDLSVALVNQAQQWYAKPLLAGTALQDLPLLSAASPMKFGSTPDAFTDIPAGQIALRNIADLYVYPNVVTAVRLDGAGVREWLERSAAFFNRINLADGTPQLLVPPRRPAYNFDVLAGVTYGIDVTQPARYDYTGKLLDAAARRIVDLRFQGQQIDPHQDFVIVTNNYRAAGGGGFPGLNGANIIFEGPDGNRDAITSFVRAVGTIDPRPTENWYFVKPERPVMATFVSSPLARAFLPDHPTMTYLSEADGGMARYGLSLG